MEGQIISKEIDYLREAVILLRIVSGSDNMARLEKRILSAVGKPTDRIRQILQLLKDIVQEAQERFQEQKKEIDYYFQCDEHTSLTAGDMVLLYENCPSAAPGKEAEQLRLFWQSLDEESYYGQFGECLTAYESGLDALEHPKALTDPMEILRTILKLNIPEEEKWKLQQIFLEPQKHREQVLPLLQGAVSLLHGHDRKIAPLTEEFYLFWSRTLEHTDIYDYIQENLGSALGKCQWGTVIRPQLMRPGTLGMQLKTQRGAFVPSPAYCWIGILYGEDLAIRSVLDGEEGNRQEIALYALKLLSDKSKFEILAYIRNRQAYGTELARQFGLTTATISHHMSTLVGEGLVEVTREDNKVFYRSRTEALRSILEYCLETLT